MSIASAITAAQGRVADAYTAVSNMGGTLPATQNLTNLPTAINSIPSGSSEVDTINTINETGSKLFKGDQVWLYKKPVYDGGQLVSEYSTTSFYDLTKENFTKQGSVTITNGVASGFSTSNYIIPACMFDNAYGVNITWEWKVKFNIETLGQFNAILGGDAGSYMLDLYVGVANKLGINISGNGSSYNIAEGVLGTKVLEAFKDYWVKLGWTGSVYYVDLSEDGINYSREITVNSTTATYSYSYPSHPLCIGFRVGNFFRGTIDLKETSVYINSTYNSNYKKMYTWRAYNIIADSPAYISGIVSMQAENNQETEVQALLPKNYNFEVVGNPTIDPDTGELTDLSANDYIYLRDVPQNITSYEIVMKVKTPANSTDLAERQYIIGNTAGHTPYIRTDWGQIGSSHPKTSSDATTTTRTRWQNSEADWVYNTDAWIKLTWNGTTFEMLRSLDGSTWTSCGTASATTLYWTNNLMIGFGGTNTVSGYLNTIYLKDCYININGKRWWNAFKAG